MKIMIVDNNITFRNALKLTINKIQGHEVVAEASNGVQALKKLKEEIPDIILLNLDIPFMDGIFITHLILHKIPSIQIIAISRENSETYLEDLLSTGIKACIYQYNIDTELENTLSKVSLGEYYFPTGLKTYHN